MLFWSLSFFFALLAIVTVGRTLLSRAFHLLSQTEEKLLRALEIELSDIQVQLETGQLPPEETWMRLRGYRAPWGSLCADSLLEIRKRGGALLPTLKRLLSLVRSHLELLQSARARSAQALAQASTGFVLIPVVGFLLFHLLPGLEGRGWTWTLVVGGGLCGVGLGSFWILALAEEARWGGLAKDRRSWPLECLVMGERFLSLLKTGSPPDLAWTRALDDISQRAPRLSEFLSPVLWSSSSQKHRPGAGLKLIAEWAHAMRMGIKASVLEGRPCQERVEQTLISLREAWRDQVEKELGLVATRALKPLFVCVAPSVLFLFATGFFWAWEAALSNGNGL